MALPPKPICDSLYKTFLCYVNPLIPLLHLPTFHDQYQRFWQWYSMWDGKTPPEGILAETPSFLPLMLSVFFTAALTTSTPELIGGDQKVQYIQRRLYHITSRSLNMVGFPHDPSIYSLEAFILIHSVLMREEESISSCSFVATAFRIAQAMGLHIDGSEFNMSSIETEERRRIWSYIMHLDVMASLLSGLPLLSSNEGSATKPISARKDELVESPDFSSTADSTADDSLYPGYVLAQGRYEISRRIRKILNSHISPQSSPSQIQSLKDMIEQLRDRTEARINKLASIVQVENWAIEVLPDAFLATHQHEGATGFLEWASHLLWLSFYRAYSLIYFPLLQENSIWTHIRSE
jgi:Fungal specific transcription factor domain